MEHIYTIIVNSDTTTKCEWFGYAYSASFYAMMAATVLLIGFVSQSKQKDFSSRFLYAWITVATISAVFSFIFYIKCFQPRP